MRVQRVMAVGRYATVDGASPRRSRVSKAGSLVEEFDAVWHGYY